VSLAALLLAVAFAAFDARTRRIPNWLTLPAIALGCLLGSPLGALAGGVLPFWMGLRGEVNGGDVKALAAIGAWLGVFGGVVAAVVALTVAASRCRIRTPLGFALVAGVIAAVAVA